MTRRARVTVTAIVAVLAATAGLADARIRTFVEEEPARPRAGAGGDLRFSQFPERTTAAGLRYDLYCPHTTEPNPLVVVALDAGETLEHAEPISHQLVRAGMIVVTVAPARDRASYPAVLAAVLDEVLAVRVLEPREPGCEHAGPLAAWGAGRGGAAVAEVVRAREAAGRPFAAVMTVFAASAREAIPDMATPLLAIEGVRVPGQLGGRARSLVIRGAEPCDLSWYNDPCRDRLSDPVAVRQRTTDLRSARMGAIFERSRGFLRAYLDGDAAARAVVEAWEPELVVSPPPRIEEPAGHGTYKLLSLPLLLGGTNQGDGGFLYGLRPEVVLARLRQQGRYGTGGGFGLGLYGELLRWSGRTTVGLGATYVDYLGGIAFALSAGIATRSLEAEREHVAAVGLFLGVRDRIDALEVLELPFGVRLDARFGLAGSEERAIMISASLDLSLVALAAIGIGALMTR